MNKMKPCLIIKCIVWDQPSVEVKIFELLKQVIYAESPAGNLYTWKFNHKQHAHLMLYQGVEIIGYAHIQFWPENRAAIRIIVIDEDKTKQEDRQHVFGIM